MSQNRRKQVRCSMCTPHRWKGNKKDRFKPSDVKKEEAAKESISLVRIKQQGKLIDNRVEY